MLSLPRGKEFISLQYSKLLLLLPPGFQRFTRPPGVLSFKNSKCALTGCAFLFLITQDTGPHYSLRFQAAHCRVSPCCSLFHFFTAYSKMQLWHTFLLLVMDLFYHYFTFWGTWLFGRFLKVSGYNVLVNTLFSIVHCQQ